MEVRVATGWDVVGDVHGCFDELWDLLGALGYARIMRLEATDGLWMKLEHPEGRKLAFVGDYTDRGPGSTGVLQLVRVLTLDGHLAARGNHDDKLARALTKEPLTTKGTPMRLSHGLRRTMQEMKLLTLKERGMLTEWLVALPHLLELKVEEPANFPRIIVSHAGVPFELVDKELDGKGKAHSIYGEVLGKDPVDGWPIRGHGWRASWTEENNALCIFGHTKVPEPERMHYTVNIDTGCVFGGALTAMRFPSLETVRIPAVKAYYDHGKDED